MKITVRKIRNYIKHLYNIVITPLYERYFSHYSDNKCTLNTSERPFHLVVSLTSYPARFSTLHLVLKSIFAQSVKPDAIVLYLDDYVDDSIIPESVMNLTGHGLIIRKVPGLLKCHTKYFYALQEYSNSLVVTVDDDLMYRKNTLKKLITTYYRFPEAIPALRVHNMILSKNNTIEKYNNWHLEYRRQKIPGLNLCATGVGGVLYPPHILPPESFDINHIKACCYKADDIWLKFMELKAGIPVVWAPCFHVHPVEIAAWRDTGLNLTNVNKNANDGYIEEMQKFTGIQLKDYC